MCGSNQKMSEEQTLYNEGADISAASHSSVTDDFDYIIAGAGCAGLSLAMHMIASGKFADKRILLVDKDAKKVNDRTWCFWEEVPGLFEPVVCKKWERLWFYNNTLTKQLEIQPYTYKMIRGIDFYNFSIEQIACQPNFTMMLQQVDHVFSSDQTTGIIVNGKVIHSSFVFNSILREKPQLSRKEYWLLQHFKGWIIETETPVFDVDTATLMDFRTTQQYGTAFCYVLPLSACQALIEYTLFSSQLLSQEDYDKGLKQYIEEVLKIEKYRIMDEETGVIPMTNFKFSGGQNNIINIGTAGGQTKGSSGYTFNFIQRHSAALVQTMIKTGHPFLSSFNPRFHFYDSVLLNILHRNAIPGDLIFSRLFERNIAADVLRFLDNHSSLRQDLKIISSLPTMPFFKAAMQQIF